MNTKHTLLLLILAFGITVAHTPATLRAEQSIYHYFPYIGYSPTPYFPVTLVTVASDGAEGNGDSGDPSISADGRFVAFWSAADNLVPNDTNYNCWDNTNCGDVFVHDRETGETVLVSVASDGTQGNSGSSGSVSISADGRFVTFSSGATNLVPGDTNDVCWDNTNCSDVFVHDRLSGQTTRVSVASDGTQGNGASYSSSISADGRYVLFTSMATNLVDGDTALCTFPNGYVENCIDVFLHDRQTGETTLISAAEDGTPGNGESRFGFISADGRFIAFSSAADNLLEGDTNNQDDVFVRDRQTGATTRVSVASDSTQANGRSMVGSISADGRFVAFYSEATNLVPGDDNVVCWDYYLITVNCPDVFVHDRQTGETTRVSIASDGTQGNDWSGGSSISADGRIVAFESPASNLVADDTNGTDDVFVHDRETGQTTRVSLDSDYTERRWNSGEVAVSADGLSVVFTSGYVHQVYVHDRAYDASEVDE